MRIRMMEIEEPKFPYHFRASVDAYNALKDYGRTDREAVSIDQNKIDVASRFDGKWVLKTNTDRPAEQVALKYKELWPVEQAFRDLKSVLETRPIYHQRDETIRRHVFCSFLALVLRKELNSRLEEARFSFKWSDIKQDLKALQETVIEENSKRLAVRSQCLGTLSSCLHLSPELKTFLAKKI